MEPATNDTAANTSADVYAAAFPETRPFWEASARGVFLLPRCTACGQVHWHPRAHCPFCFSADIAWVPASGRGTVYSFSIIRGARDPYLFAYVRIEEGPILMTNIVDTDLDTIKIGQKVKVVFKKSENGTSVPMFAPA